MTEARSGAQLLVDALERYGVDRVFGNPGTTELPVLEAVGESNLEYVLVPHEDVAVGAAAGYATVLRDRLQASRDRDDDDAASATALGDRASPARDRSAPAEQWEPLPLGVANLHLEAGVAHGLGNLYGAWTAGAPLLVTAGAHSQSFRHEEPILSGDQQRHVEPYTKWVAPVRDVDALASMVRRAVRTALTPPTGPVFLEVPMDVAAAQTDAEVERLGAIPAAGRGDPVALDRAAELLAGERADGRAVDGRAVDGRVADVVLLVGDGVARAGPAAVDAAVDLAETVGARVHGEALSAAIAYPREHELWASVLPAAEATIRDRLDADAVVLAGCSTNTTLVRHEDPLLAGDPDLVHLGADPSQLGKRLPADAAAVGDPGALCAEVAERVAARLSESERQERRATAADRSGSIRSDVQARGRSTGEATEGSERPTSDEHQRPTPADLVAALERVAPEALLVDEGIGAKYALLARWDLDHGDFHSNGGGCLGYGLPAAVGAALAEAERASPRPVVGFVGDGSYLYYPQAIRTAVRAGVDLAVVVPNNGGYGSVAAKADALVESDPEALPGLAFDEPADLAANARSHGARGDRVTERAALESTLRRAVSADGVAVVDVLVEDRR